MFFYVKDSLAAPNTAISLTPDFRAFSIPQVLGTKTGKLTPALALIPESTSDASLIWGIALGETKEVASTTYRPVSAREFIRKSLSFVSTNFFSFCKPSRGDT